MGPHPGLRAPGLSGLRGVGEQRQALPRPFHAWTYGLDGNLIAAPSMNDTVGLKNLKGEAYLPSHRVEKAGGGGYPFVTYLREGRVVAAAGVNAPRAVMRMKARIQSEGTTTQGVYA